MSKFSIQAAMNAYDAAHNLTGPHIIYFVNANLNAFFGNVIIVNFTFISVQAHTARPFLYQKCIRLADSITCALAV